jgi:hypothetical protein
VATTDDDRSDEEEQKMPIIFLRKLTWWDRLLAFLRSFWRPV